VAFLQCYILFAKINHIKLIYFFKKTTFLFSIYIWLKMRINPFLLENLFVHFHQNRLSIKSQSKMKHTDREMAYLSVYRLYWNNKRHLQSCCDPVQNMALANYITRITSLSFSWQVLIPSTKAPPITRWEITKSFPFPSLASVKVFGQCLTKRLRLRIITNVFLFSNEKLWR